MKRMARARRMLTRWHLKRLRRLVGEREAMVRKSGAVMDWPRYRRLEHDIGAHAAAIVMLEAW